MVNSQTAECPVCGGEISIPANAELNEILSCTGCEAKVEITNLGDKVELEEIKVEEDWGE